MIKIRSTLELECLQLLIPSCFVQRMRLDSMWTFKEVINRTAGSFQEGRKE